MAPKIESSVFATQISCKDLSTIIVKAGPLVEKCANCPHGDKGKCITFPIPSDGERGVFLEAALQNGGAGH